MYRTYIYVDRVWAIITIIITMTAAITVLHDFRLAL